MFTNLLICWKTYLTILTAQTNLVIWNIYSFFLSCVILEGQLCLGKTLQAMLSLQQFIWNVMDCPKKKKGGGWCVNTLGHMWHRFIFLFSNNFAQLLACILIHISDLVARTFQCFSAIWLQLLKWVGTGNKWKWVKTANKCLHVILRKIICKDKKKISVKYIIFLFCKVLRENLELQTLWSFSFF